MGWSWPFRSGDHSEKSEPTTKAEDVSSSPSQVSGFALSEEQRMRIFGMPGPASSPSRKQKQQADSELEGLIKSFQEPDSDQRTDSAEWTDAFKTQETAEEQTVVNRILPDGSLDISPQVMYPRTMSCRAHFDQAFYCQSVGGKFNDLYRYGHVKPCSEQWGAFWFCMRIRTLPAKDKEQAISAYYREREERKKAEFGSSEDVWDIRNVAVTRAFDKDPFADNIEDNIVVKE